MYDIKVRFILQFKGPHNFDIDRLFGIYNRLKVNFLGESVEVSVEPKNFEYDMFIVEYQRVIPTLDFVDDIVNLCMEHVTHSLYPHYQIVQDKETYNMNIDITYIVGIEYVAEVEEEYLTETYAEWVYEQEGDTD